MVKEFFLLLIQHDNIQGYNYPGSGEVPMAKMLDCGLEL